MKLFVVRKFLSFVFTCLEDITSRTSFIGSLLFKGVAVFKKPAVVIGSLLFRGFSVFRKKALLFVSVLDFSSQFSSKKSLFFVVIRKLLSFVFTCLEDITSRTSFIVSLLLKGVAVLKKPAVVIGSLLFERGAVLKKSALVCLLISGCFCFNVYGSNCATAATKATQVCEGMDIKDYAAVGLSVSGAVSSAQGSSASTAHKGNALMHGVLGGVAVKKCVQCGSAISSCETACTNPDCSVLPASNTHCKDKLTICEGLRSKQASFCVQGVLSGAQVALSLKAANALTDESGGDDSDGGDTIEVPLPGPNSEPDPTGHYPEGDPSDTGGEGEGIKPPETPEDDGDKDDDEDDGDGDDNGDEGPGHLSGLGGAGSSGSGSKGFDYGGKASTGLGSDMLAGNETEEDYEEEEEEAYPKSVFSRSASFAGNSDKAGYANTAGSDRASFSSGQGSNSDNSNMDRKLATNDKEDTFGKGKAGDSIFIRASRMIQKFCYGEKRCPLAKR